MQFIDIQTSELHDLAKSVGVPQQESILGEDQLIRAIQQACNHTSCYRTGRRAICKEAECPWQHDCKKLIAAWMR
jgi:hypothetical protein